MLATFGLRSWGPLGKILDPHLVCVCACTLKRVGACLSVRLSVGDLQENVMRTFLYINLVSCNHYSSPSSSLICRTLSFSFLVSLHRLMPQIAGCHLFTKRVILLSYCRSRRQRLWGQHFNRSSRTELSLFLSLWLLTESDICPICFTLKRENNVQLNKLVR